MISKPFHQLLVIDVVLSLLNTGLSSLHVILDPFWFIIDDFRKDNLEQQDDMLNYEDCNHK